MQPDKTYSIPFEQLILVLKTNGYEISVADILSIEKILLAQNILELSDTGNKHLKLTVNKLPYLITPIIAKNKNEQKELIQLIQCFVEEQTKASQELSPPYKEQPSPSVIGNKRSRTKLIGWLTISTIVVAAAAYIIYQLNKPQHLEVVIYASPTQPIIGDSVKFTAFIPPNIVANNHSEWIIGDSTFKTKSDTLMHVFTREALNVPVTFNVRTADSFLMSTDSFHINVACSKLDIQPNYKSIDPQTQLPVINSVASFKPVFSNKDLYNNDSLSYRWYVNGSLIGLADTFNFNFIEAKDYSIKLVTYTNGACLLDSLTAELLIPLKKSPVKLYITGAFDIDQVASIKPWWKIGSLIVCISILLLFLYFAFFRKRQRKKHVIDLSWAENKNEPFHLYLRNKNDFIGSGASINRIANVLRSSQKIADPILNIAGTIKKTSENAGFPTLQFRSSIKRNELIILVSITQTNQNHLTELFQWFIHRLQSEDVYIEKYYYSASPDFLFDDSGNWTSLKDLSTLKTDHMLVVFDDCRNFLSTKATTIQNEVVKTFGEWTSKAIITPIPLLDWGVVEYQFRLNNFLVAPAELEAIELLSRALLLDNPLDKPTIYPFIDDLYAVSGFDFQHIDDLKEYLENEVLFQWICALAVYPRLDWAITISLGIAIADAMNKPGDVHKTVINYNTLLKISRINWLQKDHLPNPLRIELLKNLNRDIHLLAREQITVLLEEVKDSLPPASFAQIEWESQYSTNAFFLYKHYPKKYKRFNKTHDAMEMLWPLLTDWPLKKITADRQNNLFEKKSNPAKNLNFNEYFSQRYRKIHKRNIIFTGILSVLLFLLYKTVTDVDSSHWIPFIPKTYAIDLTLDGDTCFREDRNPFLSYRPEGSIRNIPIDMANNHHSLVLNENELRGIVTVRGSDYTKDTLINFNSASAYFFFATCKQKNSHPLKPIDTLKKSLRSLIGTLPPVYIAYFEKNIVKAQSSTAFYKIALPAYLNYRKKDSITLLTNQLLMSELIKDQPLVFSEEAPIFDSVFYNERGKMLYKTSYNKPEKAFVIKTSKGFNEIYAELSDYNNEPVAPVFSITKSTAKKIASLIRSGSISDRLVSDNVIGLLSFETRKKMWQSVIAKAERDNEKKFREHGGYVDQNGNVYEADSISESLIIHSNNGLIYYHSHPDGIKIVEGRPGTMIQGPSTHDIESITSFAPLGYLFGMGSKLVYIYNSNGVIATIPFSAWNKD